MKKHNLGIIGFGGMAEYHYRACRREDIGMDCLAVFDIRENRRKKAEELGMTAYDNLEAFLADRRFDVVLVATANNFHCYYACKAMEAGYHVITEKPTAPTSGEVRKMIEISERCGVLYTVHQNRRFDHDFRLLLKALDQKLIGETLMIRSHCMFADNSGCMWEWRGMRDHGGGMLLDWGVHMLDQLLWYIGEDPESVYAVVRRIHSEEVDDNAKVILRFRNGLIAEMEVTGYAPYIDPRFTVYGTKGAIRIDDFGSKTARIRYEKETVTEPLDATAYDRDSWNYRKQQIYKVKEFTETEVSDEDLGDDWGSIYKNIVGVLDGKEELFVRPEQVLRVIRVIEAAFRSSETGEAVRLE